MSGFKEAMSTVNGWLGDVVALGLTLACVALVVQVLFPGSALFASGDIVGNVSSLVNSFTGAGLPGLLTLLVFVAIFRR